MFWCSGLRCATTSFGSVESAEALFSKSHESDTRIQDADPFGGRSHLEMVRLRRLHPCPDSLSEMMLLVISGSSEHLFSDQPKPTPSMLGHGFFKGASVCCELW